MRVTYQAASCGHRSPPVVVDVIRGSRFIAPPRVPLHSLAVELDSPDSAFREQLPEASWRIRNAGEELLIDSS